uniref:Methylcrotonoyl-CoA carboxylase subunit alpha, mitochondrial n=2 Tax=Lygus hesperus TaxID=30085 RepID=A0A0A9W7B6_LYGHE
MRLGQTGVRSAEAVGYVGAGTVEFIYDPSDKSFYFMEMNTRLQVEHPITEMVTGVDLVEWQLRVCSGEPLPLKQKDITLNGAAIEARVYAESLTPDGNFMPAAGRLNALSTPEHLQSDLRIESGVAAGDEVSVHYDPMIAKVVVWGPDQESAFTAMDTALSNFNIVGVENNVGFLRRLVNHEDLINGNVHTEFIPQHKQSLLPQSPSTLSLARAALGFVLQEEIDVVKSLRLNDNPNNPFVTEPNFRVNGSYKKVLDVNYRDCTYRIDVTKYEGWWEVCVGGECNYNFKATGVLDKNGFLNVTAASEEGTDRTKVYSAEDKLYVFDSEGEYCLDIERRTRAPAIDDGEVTGGATCPMPGLIDKVFVSPGDVVKPGDRLAVMIAMKMEYVITATTAGEVESVLVSPGQNVCKNASVIKFKEITP